MIRARSHPFARWSAIGALLAAAFYTHVTWASIMGALQTGTFFTCFLLALILFSSSTSLNRAAVRLCAAAATFTFELIDAATSRPLPPLDADDATLATSLGPLGSDDDSDAEPGPKLAPSPTPPRPRPHASGFSRVGSATGPQAPSSPPRVAQG